MKVVTLEQYEEKFLKYCNEFYNLNDRNRNWFDPNNPGSIPNSYKKYPLWTFLLDDFENLVAYKHIIFLKIVQDF